MRTILFPILMLVPACGPNSPTDASANFPTGAKGGVLDVVSGSSIREMLTERDPMACNDKNSAYSETLWTRGGVGQNRQATIVACKGKIKISSLFETEAQVTKFTLKITGCNDIDSITLGTANFALKPFDDLWNRTQRELSISLAELSKSCGTEIVEDELNLFWFKAAFQHVFETQKREIENNA